MVDFSLLLCLAAPPDRVSPGFHRLVEANHRPLLQLLKQQGLPCALGIPWGLTERWLSEGYHDCLDLCSELLGEGRVEFVGTAAYYPILPLLPRPVIERQVSDNISNHRQLFPGWQTRGFFPPELAFGPELLPILKDHGFHWCVVDDTPYSCLNDEPPFSYVPECGECQILLRSSFWSRALVGKARAGGSGQDLATEAVAGLEAWFQGQDGYAFLAVDAECFGLHRQGSLSVLSSFMACLSQGKRSRLYSPTRLLERYPVRSAEVPPGSWRTTPEQFWEGEFFAPWQTRYSAVHGHLWELTELAVAAVSKLQQKLDRTLHAGFYWWDEDSERGLPSSATRGLRTLLDVIATAAPEDLDQALQLVARVDELSS